VRSTASGTSASTPEIPSRYFAATRPAREAEVISVDLSAERITVEDVTVEKADGEEVPRPIPASNVRVAELDLEDERREAAPGG